MYGRIAIWASVCALIFFSGWYVNGLRWENKYAKSVQLVQQKEKQFQDIMDQERVKKNEEINRISDQLDVALQRLRERPSRQPSTPGTRQGANGSELSREDAEFLVREAARADQAVIELNACYRIYDEIKSKK